MNSSHNPKKISDYNSFEVFEDIYGRKSSSSFDELEIPEKKESSNLWNYILALVIIIVIAFAIHPLLSYTLKTPYPLVVIADNTMQPVLSSNDLLLAQGVISPSHIQPDDIIVFKPWPDSDVLAVKRVLAVGSGKLILKADAPDSASQEVYAYQVVAKVINIRQPIKLPLMGRLISWLN